MVQDDGDLVRGLGFVTLYSAYLEEQVDDCTELLSAADPKRPHLQSRSVNEKIKDFKKRLADLEPLSAGLQALPSTLHEIKLLFEHRNENCCFSINGRKTAMTPLKLHTSSSLWGIKVASQLLSVVLTVLLLTYVILPFPKWLMHRFRLHKAWQLF
jgi:hypothetical protein